MSDIYGIFMRLNQFLIIEWIVLNVMFYTMKRDWSCEEFGSLSENRLISFDQQAICIGWPFPEHQKGGHFAAFSEARIIA